MRIALLAAAALNGVASMILYQKQPLIGLLLMIIALAVADARGRMKS